MSYSEHTLSFFLKGFSVWIDSLCNFSFKIFDSSDFGFNKIQNDKYYKYNYQNIFQFKIRKILLG